jgi:hypothetical protein
MIKWYIFLRKQGYSISLSLSGAIYNFRHWYPEGEWPYKMKKKLKGKSANDIRKA